MNSRGITIIALILTIILMIILASITIGTINGGLFDFAGEAKNKAESTSSIDGITKAYILAKVEKGADNLTIEDLDRELNYVFGENVAKVVINKSDRFAIKIGNYYYELYKTGDVKDGGKINTFSYAGDITKGGTCTGSQSKPYRIECIEDLCDFAKRVNTDDTTYTRFGEKYILLVNDLDFNSVFSYNNFEAKYSYDSAKNAYISDENSETTIMELCTTGQGFIPIGSNCPRFFGGIFYGDKPNGERTKIKNIYINRSDNAGLFDNCSGAYGRATFKNIEIDGKITCTGSGAAAGLICGVIKDRGVVIENCVNRATIKNTGTGKAVGICAKSTLRAEVDQ